jgi:hypothetical protein
MAIRTAFAVGATATGIAGALMLSANRLWESRTDEVRRELQAANTVRGHAYREQQLEGLPLPVQRYFRAVLTDGQPLITHARVSSHGTFNIGAPPASSWKRFTATQDFYPGAPGFVWNARIRMAPGLSTFVRDAFAGGEGSMFAAVAGVITVADAGGTPQMAAGSLTRYLAEAVWFPTALLPDQGVTWTAMADDWARATLTTGATTVSLDFRFGGDGLITECAALRDHDKLGKQPWGGRYMDWVDRGGMWIPAAAEVYWTLPTGAFPYWRGSVEPHFEFAWLPAPP